MCITIRLLHFISQHLKTILHLSNVPFQNHIIFKIDFNIIFKLLLTFKLNNIKKSCKDFKGVDSRGMWLRGCCNTWKVKKGGEKGCGVNGEQKKWGWK